MAHGSDTSSPPLNELQLRRLASALGPTLEVRELLGMGGFAEVYAVWDKRLKRELAVKTLRSDIVVNEAVLQRFQREAEAMAQLRHPSIIPIYNVGEEGGVAYFTMPRIHGESLGAVLHRERIMSVPETVRIISDCASALATAHRLGLVHRDVKPENIMLEGSDRRAVVMDFGISKSLTDDMKLTGTGTAMGTPDYMSPEQAMGERNIDARSDQYSLAVVAFRMLTGRLPFEGDSTQTLIFKQVTEVAPAVQTLNPAVPTQIADAIARALAKDADARFPTIEAFAQALAFGTESGGAASGTVRRQELDFQARTAVMRKLMEPKLAAAALAAIALATLVVAHGRTYSLDARRLAGTRAEATFAARSFVAARGGYTEGVRNVDSDNDTAFAFIRTAAGRDSADRLAMAEPTEHYWTVTYLPQDKNIMRRWQVSVSSAGHVLRYDHLRPDTLRDSTLQRAAALALAENELRARGWDLAQLRFLRDSVFERPARRDWLFQWERPAPSVSLGRDTARALITTVVRGSEVARYSARWQSPAGFGRAAKKPAALQGVGWAFLVIVVGFTVSALAWTMARQRADVLRWTTAARVCGFAVACLVVYALFPTTRSSLMNDNDGIAVALTSFGILTLIAASWFVLAFALVESLASERRPTLMSGIHDLAAGRFVIPEIPVAALYGTVGGLVLAALGEILDAAQIALTPRVHPDVASALNLTMPMALTVFAIPLAIVAATYIPYVLFALERRRIPRWVIFVVPALLFVGIQVGFATATPWRLAISAIDIAGLTFLVWRYGWLSGVIATLILTQISGVVATLRFGGDDVRLPTLLTVAILAAPIFVGISAYRRYAPIRPARSTPTSA